jgi:tRNA(Glu) U13 pseudouridine synthase TruD
MKQADLGDMFKKASNSILCNSGISWLIEHTPLTSSVMKTSESTEQDHDESQPASTDNTNGIHLWLVVQHKV